MAENYYNKGQLAKAREGFLLLTNLYPDEKFAGVAILRIGDIAQQEGNLPFALELYEEVLDYDTPNDLGYKLAQLRLTDAEIFARGEMMPPDEMKRISEIYRAMAFSEEEHPFVARYAYWRVAMVLYRYFRVEESVPKLEGFLKKYPPNPLTPSVRLALKDILRQLVEYYYLRGDYLELVLLYNTFDFAFSGSAVDGEMIRKVVYAYEQLGLFEYAREASKKAVVDHVEEAAKDFALLQDLKAEFAYRNYEDVENGAIEFLEMYPVSVHLPDVYHLVGDACYEREIYDRAVKYYTLAKKRAKRRALPCILHFNLGNALMQLRDYEAAAESFHVACKVGADQDAREPGAFCASESYFNRAQAQFEAGALREAITAYDDAIRLYSDNARVPAAYVRMGEALARMGRKEEAKKSWDYVIAQFPEDIWSRIAQDKILDIAFEEALSRRLVGDLEVE